MFASRISAWIAQGKRHAAMDLALDMTNLAICAYTDDADGLVDFLEDAECAYNAVLKLRKLMPAHIRPDLDQALREIDCALTDEGAIDDRIAAVDRAHRALLHNRLLDVENESHVNERHVSLTRSADVLSLATRVLW